MKPIVHGLQAQYADRIQFTYLDIDDPAVKPLKDEYGFTLDARPLFVLLSADGQTLKRWVGVVAKEDLEQALREALQ